METLYQVLYADPPWRYDFSQSDSRKIENNYPTMSMEEICAIKIPTDKNAVLYLWATSPKLLEALEVMKSWGFTYKSHAVWDKEKIGMGYWFRGQHELLLVGTKGDFSPPPATLRISSVIRKIRGIHSRKPFEVIEHISQCYPNLKKIELFARLKWPNWDSWGNTVANDIEIDAGSKQPMQKINKIEEGGLFSNI
jgi:N6-adenosine-specific RNA methylase IME4